MLAPARPNQPKQPGAWPSKVMPTRTSTKSAQLTLQAPGPAKPRQPCRRWARHSQAARHWAQQSHASVNHQVPGPAKPSQPDQPCGRRARQSPASKIQPSTGPTEAQPKQPVGGHGTAGQPSSQTPGPAKTLPARTYKEPAWQNQISPISHAGPRKAQQANKNRPGAGPGKAQPAEAAQPGQPKQLNTGPGKAMPA
jgi:hypothetical protein